MTTHEIALAIFFSANLVLFVVARTAEDAAASLIFGGGVAVTGLAIVGLLVAEIIA